MNFYSAAIKLVAFTTAMVVLLFGLMAVFANMRFSSYDKYHALFTSQNGVSGLKSSELVRIAGVEVGKVADVSLRPDNTVDVAFNVKKNVDLPASAKVGVRWHNLIGDHYLEISRGDDNPKPLALGGVIPVSQTDPGIDLDALVGGFKPLFQALEPTQVNRLTESLVGALQGEGGTVANVLSQIGTLTDALADRDELIGSVINNLNQLLGTIDDKRDQLDSVVVNMQEVVSGLNKQAGPIADAVASTQSAARSVAGLLGDTRPSIKEDVKELGRLSRNINSDSKYLDDTLGSLPDVYKKLTRLGIFGDFFSFYLCDANLKVNGKDGNPMYIKLAAQDAGRCTPN